MPNRIIREGILSSARLNELDLAAEVFYRRLMSKVDDHGLYDARPSILRATLYPLRVDRVREADISRWMAICQKAGLIVLYETDGKHYLKMLNTHWQTRSAPKYPVPPASNCAQLLTTDHLDVVVDVVVDVVSSTNVLEVDKGLVDHAVPPCPQKEIIDLYHEKLPLCPRVREWNDSRQGYLRARWREKARDRHWKTVDEGLDMFAKLFEFISESKFLTGKATAQPGKPPFLADLEWILRPTNWAKIIEGKYHHDPAV